MTITVTCKACGTKLQVPRSSAGKRIRCPECEEVQSVARPREESASRSRPSDSRPRAESASRSRPAGSRSPERTAPVRSRNVPEPDERKLSPVLIPGLIAGVCGVALLVGIVAYQMGKGGDDPKPQADVATHVPEPTNEQLAKADPNPIANNSSFANLPGSLTPTPPATNPPANNNFDWSNSQTAAGGPLANQGTNSTNTTEQPSFGFDAQTSNTNSPTPQATDPPPVETAPADTPPRPELGLADLNDQIEPSVVRVDVIGLDGNSNGSGYVVDKSGLVVTNYHVIEGATRATVAFSDGSTAPVAGLVKVIGRKDIAILKINYPQEKLKPLKLAKVLPRKGISVVAFGAPLGLSFSMSEGIISGIRSAAELKSLDMVNVDGTWLQTTSPISPGNSGGPLVNRQGELVGMNTMTLTIGQNLNFAISSLDVVEALSQIPSSLMALSPQNTPPVSKSTQQERGKVINVAGTPKGAQLLGQLKQIVLFNIELGFNDVTGNVSSFLELQANRALDQAGIKLIKRAQDVQDPAIMILGLKFDDLDKGAAGAQELELMIALLWRGTDENGVAQTYLIYEAKEKVGTFAQASLYQGVIPRRVQDSVGTVFRKYTGAFRKAQRDAGSSR